MKYLLLYFIALILPTFIFAQVSPIDLDSELQEVPKKVEKGLVITSADSLIQMKLGLHFQNRVTYVQEENEEFLEGDITKASFKMQGYVFSPKLTYAVEASFSPKNIKAPKDGEPSQILRNALVIYKPNSNWEFKFGQGKLPGNRQSNNSSSKLQLTDRSINHSKFNIGRDFGFQVYNKMENDDKFSYAILTAISFGEGINWIGKNDTGLAYTGKVELYPLGTFKKGGAHSEGDLEREENPKFMISSAFSQNNQAQRERGQNGKILFESRTMKSFFADFIFKYQGWAFMSAYMNRSTTDALTYNPQNLDDFRYVFVGEGLDLQASYVFRNYYEVVGRFSQQWMDKKIRMYEPNRQQFSLGVNKYIWKHQLKLQTEATYETLTPENSSTQNAWYVRFQLDFSI